MKAHGLISGSIALCVLVLAACGSPLVGLECRTGFTRCGQSCVDLASDPTNCGSCGQDCGNGIMCLAGRCAYSGAADGGVDGSVPSGRDAGGESSPLCDGTTADCICGFGGLRCDNACVEAATDPTNCGDCGVTCDPEDFCVEGGCLAQCDAPLVACGPECIDVVNNIDHCGVCYASCASGLCTRGICQGVSAGHVIAIGHDLSVTRGAIDRLAANSIFLPFADPLRILLYEKDSSTASKAGLVRALRTYSVLTGREFEVTVGIPLTVPFLLRSSADVFVINAQQATTDELLNKNGKTWSAALKEFVRRGGTVVLFDGGGTHRGTFQILKTAGLFDAKSRTALSARKLDLAAAGDAVATGVPRFYQSQGATVGFDSEESTVVVRDLDSKLPVVIHVAR